MSENKRFEVKEAKIKDIRSLEDYETFELVEDVGQEMIGSHWVITKKENHDGQKTEYKAWLWLEDSKKQIKGNLICQ